MNGKFKRRAGRCATPDIIINASLQLFNLHGERRITTNHIAQQLSISTGNLYYHYSNKEEIIIELLGRYVDGLVALLEQGENNTKSLFKMAQLLTKTLKHQWQYRFILHGRSSLFVFNDLLRSHYLQLEKYKIEKSLETLFLKMNREGNICGSERAIKQLAKQFQLLQEAWVSAPERVSSTTESALAVNDGCKMMLSFLYPYLGNTWRSTVERICIL
ncbi:TetR/AcrR family transcriptional regulator [Crenobacter sp. SG2305]|uniref:TetR/AcrR family transcriptional regulator n=1 Tax=Crenobacter oryzisoli TaxID=3056844 RepID=UPI0025AAF044|nr:TetR/AcrR family transcriptional regulator [Crenobacter sp. SG2305]MDN0083273.1 TetR/AcrR family transcriptional regulator [Crenobacter sp. SG2305]